jgi:hypothetical protein
LGLLCWAQHNDPSLPVVLQKKRTFAVAAQKNSGRRGG